jgi:hypothetical protein
LQEKVNNLTHQNQMLTTQLNSVNAVCPTFIKLFILTIKLVLIGCIKI